MKILEYPLRKTFKKPFVNSDFETLFILVYEQSTIEEFHEFIALSPMEQMDSILEMILSNCPRNWIQKIIGKWGIYFGKEKLIRNGLKYGKWVEEFMQEIIASKFRMYESIFDKEESGEDKKPDVTKAVMYSQSVANICAMFKIPGPEDLFKNYTLEQYYWMSDGVRYKANLSSKDGIAENDRALTIPEEKEKEINRIRENIENFKPKK